MEFIWAIVVLIIGIAAVLAYAKNNGKRLELRKAQVDFERAKLNEDIEKRLAAQSVLELDAEIERDKQRLVLAKAEATKDEDIQLAKAEKLLQAARMRQQAAEADAKAQVAAATVPEQIEADKELIKERQQARIAAAVAHAKTEKQPAQNPLLDMDILKFLQASLEDHNLQRASMSDDPLTLGEYIKEFAGALKLPM